MIKTIKLHKVTISDHVSHLLHKSHAPLHALYFAMVAVEAGHWYGAAAGALFLLTIADSLTAEA